MSCHRDDKFDSQKLILLRTFNWCATSHDGYLSKTGRSDGRIPRGMLFYVHYLARDGQMWHWEATWNDTKFFQQTGVGKFPRPSQRAGGGGEVWRGPRPSPHKTSFGFQTVQALSRGLLSAPSRLLGAFSRALQGLCFLDKRG